MIFQVERCVKLHPPFSNAPDKKFSSAYRACSFVWKAHSCYMTFLQLAGISRESDDKRELDGTVELNSKELEMMQSLNVNCSDKRDEGHVRKAKMVHLKYCLGKSKGYRVEDVTSLEKVAEKPVKVFAKCHSSNIDFSKQVRTLISIFIVLEW